ncbi:class I SAM-dependent methyltransferase [Ligilactobacillus salivarius]|uniref:class I SAM-dependent methyltransferase n=1 Tax=Ligilactobacillus salivarius TaxID=1624 RepID=UPI001368B987|nr:class I SAM-dependent methyltransferase [Ligilactobacillus salivarius]MYY91369.1 class I SAM-dependent methyltransferase [Ligilactobacillus salivarius]
MIGKMKKIQKEYSLLEEAVKELQKNLQTTYLDALIETLENILDNNQVHVEDDKPDKKTVAKLKELYADSNIKNLEADEKRQVIRLLILKSYSEDKIQANHQMTPDSIGMIVSYLIELFADSKKVLTITDICVGTGNLLTDIYNNLDKQNKNIQAYGIDNDDTLLALASISTQFQKQNIELYHQDAIEELLIPKTDLVVGDLPVGYYPIDDKVSDYITKNNDGHSYAHYVLIEKSIRQLKEDGIGIFIVPRGIFEVKDSVKLLKYIQKVGYLQGLLNLPTELFNDKQSMKSILVVQKKGNKAKQAEEVLLGDFPSFKKQEEFKKFINEIVSWAKKNIYFN